MSPTEQFTEIIRAWAEVFMHRSMADFRRFMGETGLSFPQINVLMRLYYHGQCGVSEIGSQMGVTNAAVSQVVERLVQLGLVERREDPDDRRARRLSLTPEGQVLIERGIAVRQQWIQDLATSLAPEQRQKIIDALTLLTQQARQREA